LDTEPTSADTSPYPPPLDRLLTLGDVERGEADYLALGIGEEHVAELIRMSLDPALNHAEYPDPRVWAPVHAWRALGQLRAEAAAEPLTALFHELLDLDDWLDEEMPAMYAQIGPAAVPPLVRYVEDRSRPVWARVTAAACLTAVAQAHPDTREACVAALVRVLDESWGADVEALSFVASNLLDLRAAEAAPALERALAERRIAEQIVGDAEDVQVALGILPERLTPRRRYNPFANIAGFGDYKAGEDDVETADGDPEPADLAEGARPVRIIHVVGPDGADRREPPRGGGGAGRKDKAKRKAAKASRRKNRRK
jgi:hypothetical protein